MTCWGFGFKGYDLKTTKLVIILFILGRNFWTRNARKLIKVSKVTDSHLVSIENLSEILPSSGWAQARYQQPKIAKNLPYLWRQSQKTRNPKPKNFFHCRLKTYQVFWGFEQRSSAIDWGAMRLVSQLKYPKFFPISKHNILIHQQWTCLRTPQKQAKPHLELFSSWWRERRPFQMRRLSKKQWC